MGVQVVALPRLDIEDQLRPVERYALNFAQFIDPVVTIGERREAEAQLKFQEDKWQVCVRLTWG